MYTFMYVNPCNISVFIYKIIIKQVMSKWNITLFHYRNSGAQTSSVLLGLQIPPADAAAFAEATKALATEFTFRELDEQTKKAFENFIQ